MKPDTPRWTEIEHLPEWDEEFYLIYTAKKFGKWVMIKTLRPEYADKPEYQAMIEREFDVRYNLAHPNIVMINDFEDIPGIGRCIVTDDVYGDSLRKLIDEHRLTDKHLAQMRHQLVDALQYINSNHIVHAPLKPENIIFTENIGNLKLIDVGFEQRPSLSPRDISDDIRAYGEVLAAALESNGCRDAVLHSVARKCLSANPADRYTDFHQLHFALEDRSPKRFVWLCIISVTITVLMLIWVLALR